MEEALHPDEFAVVLRRELAEASERRARGLHVQVSVPAHSAYRWTDGEGDGHAVFLPTTIKTTLMRFPGDPQEDGGPAAVFHIDSGGHVPPDSVTTQMADELYRECVRWGRIHHAIWEEGPAVDLPELPSDFDEIVQTAIYMDVS